MTMWYAFWPSGMLFWSCGKQFQNQRKLQFRIIKGEKLLKPWHNSELRNYLLEHIRPYTHLQNNVQCMNNNVYIMYI